jgi:hypothetical protein
LGNSVLSQSLLLIRLLTSYDIHRDIHKNYTIKHKIIILISNTLLDIRQKIFKLTFRHFTSLTMQHWTQNFCKESPLFTFLLAHFIFSLLHIWLQNLNLHMCTYHQSLPYLKPLFGSCSWCHLQGSWGFLTRMDLRKDWRPETHKRTHSLRKGMTRHKTRRLMT